MTLDWFVVLLICVFFRSSLFFKVMVTLVVIFITDISSSLPLCDGGALAAVVIVKWKSLFNVLC